MNKKLKDVEDYAKRLMAILEAAIKGEEPPIELILKHNRGAQESINKYNKKLQDNDLKDVTIRHLTQQNLNIVEALHQSYIDYMNKICDNYAIRYGNDCNMQ